MDGMTWLHGSVRRVVGVRHTIGQGNGQLDLKVKHRHALRQDEAQVQRQLKPAAGKNQTRQTRSLCHKREGVFKQRR